MVNSTRPFMNVAPGEFIREEIEERNWRQEDLADILGISVKSVNQIIKNKQSITPDVAILLGNAFGQTAQYWLNLDNNYRLRVKQDQRKTEFVKLKSQIYKYMPIQELVKKGWICKSDDIRKFADEVKKFWNIDRLDFSFLENQLLPKLRKSSAYSQFNEFYSLCWFRMAQKAAKYFQVKSFQKEELAELAKNLHQFSLMEKGLTAFLNELNTYGVKFFVLSHLQKTYTDGASFWDGKNPVIVYTCRFDRIDNFWFTVAHEIAHILLHLEDTEDFYLDNMENSTLKSDDEKQADELAGQFLQIDRIIDYFIPFKQYISKIRVENCSAELQVHPAIIVGALQHHGMLDRTNLNKLKQKILPQIPHAFLAENFLSKIRKCA